MCHEHFPEMFLQQEVWFGAELELFLLALFIPAHYKSLFSKLLYIISPIMSVYQIMHSIVKNPKFCHEYQNFHTLYSQLCVQKCVHFFIIHFILDNTLLTNFLYPNSPHCRVSKCPFSAHFLFWFKPCYAPSFPQLQCSILFSALDKVVTYAKSAKSSFLRVLSLPLVSEAQSFQCVDIRLTPFLVISYTSLWVSGFSISSPVSSCPDTMFGKRNWWYLGKSWSADLLFMTHLWHNVAHAVAS